MVKAPASVGDTTSLLLPTSHSRMSSQQAAKSTTRFLVVALFIVLSGVAGPCCAETGPDREPLPDATIILKQLETGGNIQPLDDESLLRSDSALTSGSSFKLLSSKQIRERLLTLSKRYPGFVQVTTSQEAYGLPAAGTKKDCKFDSKIKGCANYFMVLQDFTVHPEGSMSAKQLPHVLWSGELHGDERVGPTAVVEAAELLLRAAQCEHWIAKEKLQAPSDTTASVDGQRRQSLRGRRAQRMMKMSSMMKMMMAGGSGTNPGGGGTSGSGDLSSKIRDCTKHFEDTLGVSTADRQWLARILATRRIVVVPTANALGYDRNVRGEGFIDPNRDFPYDKNKPEGCMNTIAARTLNELFRAHMFQISLTFHGGIELLGYEWGNPTWGSGTRSPDDTAQEELTEAMSRYGGKFSGSSEYVYGVMNDILYAVRGGMEDWAYASSWDTKRNVVCKPKTFGGYPAKKTLYHPSTCRSFNILVETSNRKTPKRNSLGTWHDILSSNTTGNGHVSRNVRVALLAADLVQPYVQFTSLSKRDLLDDPALTPGIVQDSCPQRITVPKISLVANKLVVEWQVGGSFKVDKTSLWFAPFSPDIPNDLLDCREQPQDLVRVQQFLNPATMAAATSGSAARFGQGKGTTFTGEIDISQLTSTTREILILASARVDQNWQAKKVPNLVPTNMSPQSHVVNARTNTSWSFETAAGKIQGRTGWFSQPLIVKLQD